MLSLQHSHGYSGSFLNYITMDNHFLDLIERSIKEHWDLPAFSDYNGHTFHFKDVARRIEKFHILLEHAGIKKGDKVGKVKYFLSGKEIGSIDIVAAESVDEISYKSAMGDTVKKFLL